MFRNLHALRDVVSFSKFGDFSLFPYSATSIISKLQLQKPEPSRSCATVNRTTFFDFQRTVCVVFLFAIISYHRRIFNANNHLLQKRGFVIAKNNDFSGFIGIATSSTQHDFSTHYPSVFYSTFTAQ